MTRPLKLRRASAYYRNAAKATRQGRYAEAERYRHIADRLVDENRRDQERVAAWKQRAAERDGR